MGLGRLGVCPCGRAGQLTVSREACLSRVVGLSGAGMRDTPAAALLGGGGCPRVPLVCGGGMLSGFWGSAPWLPDLSGAPDLLLGVVGGCGWVGCELYSGREHLTVRFLRQNCFLFCSCVICCLFF